VLEEVNSRGKEGGEKNWLLDLGQKEEGVSTQLKVKKKVRYSEKERPLRLKVGVWGLVGLTCRIILGGGMKT